MTKLEKRSNLNKQLIQRIEKSALPQNEKDYVIKCLKKDIKEIRNIIHTNFQRDKITSNHLKYPFSMNY